MLQGVGRPSKTVGVQATALNPPANADGDPAARGMKILATVGRCNVEREGGTAAQRIKGVDLESESQ
jgi:hypothetical protein